jgi:hypothetical protein
MAAPLLALYVVSIGVAYFAAPRAEAAAEADAHPLER